MKNSDLNIIISALKPSQYRKYWQAHKGKKYKSKNTKPIDFDTFIDQYIEIHRDELDEAYVSDYEEIVGDIYYEAETSIDPEDYPGEDIDDVTMAAVEEMSTDYYDEWWREKRIALENDQDIIDEYEEMYGDGENPYEETINTKVKHIYDDLFDGKNRILLTSKLDINSNFDVLNSIHDIYLDCKDDFRTLIQTYLSLFKKIDESLSSTQQHHEIVHMSHSWDITTESLTKKCFIDEHGRFIKIRKLISDITRKDDYFKEVDYIKSVSIALTRLDNLGDTKNLETKLIISRHPYDIAGMSTNRGWSSCMKLPDAENRQGGSYHDFVLPTITGAGLIAYVLGNKENVIEKNGKYFILKTDKDTGKKIYKDVLYNPRARLLIKPYTKKDEETNFDHPNWILKLSKIYGEGVSGVRDTIQQWLDSNWDFKYGIKGETYILPDYFYRDGEDSIIQYS
jgi:hypothetical protein